MGTSKDVLVSISQPLFFVIGLLVCNHTLANEEQFSLPRTETFGFAISGLSCALSPGFARNELGMPEDRASELHKSVVSFQASEPLVKFMQSASLWRNQVRTVKGYSELLNREKEKIDQLNDSMFEVIGRHLKSSKQKKRFREVVTQHLLWEGKVAEACCIHEIVLTAEHVKTLRDELPEYHGNYQRVKELERELRAAAAYAAIEETMSEDAVSEAAGPEFLLGASLIHKPNPNDAFLNQDDGIIKLLSKPRVHAELKVTIKQLNLIKPAIAKLTTKNTISRFFLAGNGKESRAKEAKEIARRCSDLLEMLDDEQRHRLAQLRFRYHVENLQFDQALKVSGVRKDHDITGVQVHVLEHYLLQERVFLDYFKVFASLVGSRKARQLCGAPYAPYCTRYQEAPPEEDEIRNKILAQIGKSMKNVTGSKSVAPVDRRRQLAPSEK